MTVESSNNEDEIKQMLWNVRELEDLFNISSFKRVKLHGSYFIFNKLAVVVCSSEKKKRIYR